VFHQLPLTDARKVKPLFALLDYNLVIESVLSGATDGRLFVDDPKAPKTVLLAYKHHLFLAGSSGDPEFRQVLKRLIDETLFPPQDADVPDAFYLHLPDSAWQPHLETLLDGRYPVAARRQYYECNALRQDWRLLLPDGFSLHPVTADLLDRPGLEHVEDLRQELCSERNSVDEFLQKSFGFALLNGRELAAWCLSEYNTADRCEVGVATVEKYQRRGLGTIVTLALVGHALNYGYTRIGWHCWTNNTPSVALALRAGFEKIHDYTVQLCVFDLAVQFAIHGNDHRSAVRLEDALAWYERSVAHGGAPAWVYYNTASCLARLNQPEQALHYLRQALEYGFDDLEHLAADLSFTSLHTHPAWEALINRSV
jgi:RimJ/RimL family protein N-acetyltransferase